MNLGKIIWIIGSLIILSGCYPKRNNTYNLDFEGLEPETHLPMDWGLGYVHPFGVPVDSVYSFYSVDSVNRHGGKYSLCIDWSNPIRNYTAAGYAIRQLYKAGKIKLTGFIKTENVKDGFAGLWMRLDSANYAMEFDNMADHGITGTTEWREYSIEMTYDPEYVKRIIVGGIITGEGKMWLDDLHLTINGIDINQAPKEQKEYYDYYNDEIVRESRIAELDTVFSRNVIPENIKPDSEKIRELANLGMIWGLIKYNHEDVARGGYNMDAELFRILPKIIGSSDAMETNKILEQWVDHFGCTSYCTDCDDFRKTHGLEHEFHNLLGGLPGDGKLSPRLKKKIEYIKNNPFAGIEHYYVDTLRYEHFPVFRNEFAYQVTGCPGASLRLLALYRFWNAVAFYDPCKNVPWDDVLKKFIPVFIAAKTTTEYEEACLKLTAALHDTRAGVYKNNNEPLITGGKGYMLPAMIARIENKIVVTGLVDSFTHGSLQKGDIILAVNDIPIDSLVKKYLPLIPASTDAAFYDAFCHLIALSATDKINLTIDRDGIKVKVQTHCIRIDDRTQKLFANPNKLPKYKLTSDGIGIIQAGLLEPRDYLSIEQKMSNAKTLIIDLRNYPQQQMPIRFLSWLCNADMPDVGIKNACMKIPGTTIRYPEEMWDALRTASKKHFAGKVLILVDHSTGSIGQNDAFIIAASGNNAHPRVLVGRQTCGGGYHLCSVAIPGGLTLTFSADVFDNTNGPSLFQNGLPGIKEIKPTISGVKLGRDEVMEEALRMAAQ